MLIFNCCYGLLISQLLKGSESLLTVINAYPGLVGNNKERIKKAINNQMNYMLDWNPCEYWLARKGYHDMALMIRLYSPLNGYTQSLISIQFGSCLAKVNPIFLGPISSVGMLSEVFSSYQQRYCEASFRNAYIKVKGCISCKACKDNIWNRYRTAYSQPLSNYYDRIKNLGYLSQDSCNKNIIDNIGDLLDSTHGKVEIYQFPSGNGDLTLFRYNDENILIDGGVKDEPSF